jgi:hypothetical protein
MDIGVIVMSGEEVARYFDKLERNLIEKLTNHQGLNIESEINLKHAEKNDAFLTEAQVMQIFGVNSTQYWHRFVAIQNVPHSKIGRKTFVYLKDEITDFVKQRSTSKLMQSGRRSKLTR